MQGPLTQDDLFPHGPLGCLGRAVYVFDTIDTTNGYLLSRAGDTPDGSVAWAEFQTAGRGRLGHSWTAPRGAALLLSVLRHVSVDSPLLTLAGLAGAVAASEAIEACGEWTPAIRWPNDLVLGGRKVGGVLAESCALPNDRERRAVVIGVGVNCLQHPRHFPPELADKATSLDSHSQQPVDRAGLAAAVLARLDAWLNDGVRPRDLRAAWTSRCTDVGTRVSLTHDGKPFAGTAVDISDEGDLIVQLDHGGRRQFAAATTQRAW